MNSVSVVMTTFNGSKFIIEQLESIMNQTRKPDEVLIFDDGSTDGTIESITNFIREFALDWKLIKNPVRLGWRSNFFQGFQAASKDLIFPCDQDDIWDKDKIRIMSDKVSSNNNCALLVSNYSVLYDPSYKGKRKKTEQLNDLSVAKLPMAKLQNIERPGCTFCFEKSFFEDTVEFWKEPFAHDGWLWMCAISAEQAFIVNYQSIVFRRHVDNNSPRYDRSKEDQIQLRARRLEIFLQVKCFSEYKKYSISTKYLEALMEFYSSRIDFIKSFSIPLLLRLLKNREYYYSFKNFLLDLKLSLIG